MSMTKILVPATRWKRPAESEAKQEAAAPVIDILGELRRQVRQKPRQRLRGSAAVGWRERRRKALKRERKELDAWYKWQEEVDAAKAKKRRSAAQRLIDAGIEPQWY